MKTLIVICMVLISVSANAVLLSEEGYCLDTDTNLDWLHSSYTLGKSYNRASSVFNTALGGGWRYATEDEVDNLFYKVFENFYPNTDYGSSYSGCIYAAGECVQQLLTYPGQLDDIHEFQGLFSSASLQSFSGKMTYGLYANDALRKGFSLPSSNAYLLGAYENEGFTDAVYGPDRKEYGVLARYGQPIMFTFAVRDHCDGPCERPVFVPEPPVSVLMASGIALLAGSRIFRGKKWNTMQ
ncbi:MAG: hypothetical protein ACWGQW_11285 [bacterium]